MEVNKSRFSIGSAEDNDLVIPGISPKHLIIYNIDGKWVMMAADIIKLNDRDFRGEAEIRDGDVVELGDHVIEFIAKSKNEGYFRVLSGRDAGKLIPVEKSGIIGRSPAADYRLSDPYVSRKHARIYVEDGSYYIEDLHPKNPILLNDRVLQKRTALHSGDEIRMGKTRLLFINPAEKEEKALYTSNRKPFYVFSALAVLVLFVVSIYWFLGRRETLYYQHVSNAKIYVSRAASADNVVNKIKFLNMALSELEDADKYGDVGNLDELVRANLNAWQDVMRAMELVSGGQVDSARMILRKAEPILGNNEIFSQIYARVQRLSVATQALAAAETLEKSGRTKEAQELRKFAMKYIPTKSSRSSEDVEKSVDKGMTFTLDLPKPEEVEGKISLKEGGLLKEASMVDIISSSSKPDIGPDLQLDDGDIDLPESDLVKATRRNGKNVETGAGIHLTGMSILELRELYKAGDLNKLIKKAKEYLKRSPNDAAAEYYLNLARKELKARALSRKGNITKAIQAWSEVLQLDPYNERAKKAIVELGSK